MAQLAQRFRLDLTDAFTGDRERVAHFFKGVFEPSSRPKRILMTFSSRGVSVFSSEAVCS